jgi:hypothetical protein
MKNRLLRAFLLTGVLATLVGTLSFAQSGSTDPAIQKAREETLVVYDLGRMFGYLNGITKDSKVAALTTDQLKKLHDIALEIEKIKRLEPPKAKALLTQIEDKILTPAQLVAVDKLAAAAAKERAATQTAGTGTGSSSGGNVLASYVSGGDFNPILDKTKTMGQDFYAFIQYAAKKIGR